MKIYDSCKSPEIIPNPSHEFAGYIELSKNISEELGISKQKSKIIYTVMCSVIENAILTGKSVRLGDNVVLEPVTITESVEEVKGNRVLYKVTPQYNAYMVRVSNSMKEQVHKKKKPYYVLKNTNKILTQEQVDKFSKYKSK